MTDNELFIAEVQLCDFLEAAYLQVTTIEGAIDPDHPRAAVIAQIGNLVDEARDDLRPPEARELDREGFWQWANLRYCPECRAVDPDCEHDSYPLAYLVDEPAETPEAGTFDQWLRHKRNAVVRAALVWCQNSGHAGVLRLACGEYRETERKARKAEGRE